MTFLRTASLASLACLLLAGVSMGACSSDPAATPKPKTECTPGESYFCRCANRDEGSRVCNDDGQTYGACEPCFEEEPLPTEDVFVPELDAGDGGGPCPNGVVDMGEECDDGNSKGNDGCSTTCKLEGASATADKCPGMAVHVWDKPVVYNVSTQPPFVADYAASPACNGTTGSQSEDRVFAVTAHSSGKLRVAATLASFDLMLYAATVCPTSGTAFAQVACANAATGNASETLEIPITEGQTVFIVVDGGAVASKGTAALAFSIVQ